MFKRVACIALACVLGLLSVMPTAAQTTFPLLNTDETALSSSAGEAVYNDAGELQLTAPTADGATVSIDINETIYVPTVRYLQLSVTAQAPFNIALKLSGAQYDLFPQTAGPSWYEVFQEEAPAEGEGVKAGSYTVSLDVAHYIDYNGIEISQNGYATVKAVYIALRGAGTLTVHHLALSDTPTFTSPNGQVGEAATTKAPITTAPHDSPTGETTLAGQDATDTSDVQTTATYGSVATPHSVRDDYDRGGLSTTLVWVLVVGGVLIVASAVLPFLNKRKNKKSRQK